MQLNNSIFDDLFRKKLDQLDAESTGMNWDDMLKKLSDSGLTDLDADEIGLHNVVAGSAVNGFGAEESDWDLFEQQLAEAETESDAQFDSYIKSSLDKVAPSLANNSWNDFYLIYRNYISLRRSIFTSRVLELVYVGLIFVFMGNLDYTMFYENDIMPISLSEKEQEVFIADTDSNDFTGSDGIDNVPNSSSNLLEEPTIAIVSVDKTEESNDRIVSDLDEASIDMEATRFVAAQKIPVQTTPSLITSSEETIEEEYPRNTSNSSTVIPEANKKRKLFLVSAYYGHSAALENSWDYSLSNLNWDFSSRSKFVGMEVGIRKGIFEFLTGVNLRENVSMEEIYADEIRFVDRISVIQVPASLKLFLNRENTHSKPFVRFGGSGSFVVFADSGEESPLNIKETEKPTTGGGRVSDGPSAPALDDFKQLYFSLDLGLGYEYQFNSGVSLFMDVDYRYFLNNYKTTVINPNYFMLNNVSGRLGGRVLLGSK